MGVMKFAKIALGNLFKKPATLMYPVKKKEYYERTRGHIDIDVTKCIFCGICVKKCPTKAINVDRVKKNWGIERMQCIQCGSCVENCPKKCLSMKKEYTEPNTSSIKDEFNA